MVFQPVLAQIYMFAGSFPPKGYAFCNGQTLSISQNAALFSLIGTTFGGDGIQTFALPNLQGRIPMHVGPGFVQGQSERRGGAYPHDQRNTGAHAHPRRRIGGGDATVAAKQCVGGEYSARLFGQRAEYHDGSTGAGADRRQPAARQYATVFGHRLHHRPCGRLPVTGLSGRGRSERRRSKNVRTISRWDLHVRRQLRAERVRIVQRPVALDQPELGALLDHRHGLRRQRHDDLCPAEFARCVAAQFRSGAGANSAKYRR